MTAAIEANSGIVPAATALANLEQQELVAQATADAQIYNLALTPAQQTIYKELPASGLDFDGPEHGPGGGHR